MRWTMSKMTMVMKLSGLLLFFLLALSSANVAANSTEDLNGSLLDPDLGEMILEISTNDSMLADEALSLPPVELARKHGQPLPFDFGSPTLKWQTWRGSLPKGAVAMYNRYTRRYDYICKYRCEAGFYNPRMGPYCHYPFAKRAYRCAPFEILVNIDNFEFLEWRPGSFGRVPQNSVGTCSRGDIYVGMNKYGLGKVHPKHRAFFLPWKGREYWYRKGYQVLSVNKGVISEQISDFKYKIDGSRIFRYPPQTMRVSSIANHACREVTKTVRLSKTDRVQHRWDNSFSSSFGVTSSFSVGIPKLVESSIEISTQTTLEFSKGTSITEEHTHSVNVDLSVPPNHYCRARMLGFKYKMDIPYSARLTRIHYNGRKSQTIVTGTYRGVQMGEVKAIVDRCNPIPNAEPCH